MMKALIIANYAGFVGFLLNDIRTLQNMGYSVDFAANNNAIKGENHIKQLSDLGINFIQLDFDGKNPFSKGNIKAYKVLKQVLEKKKYELIHCHTPIVGLIARMAARKVRKTGTKVVYTTHGLSYTHISGLKDRIIYKNIEKFASRFTDAIITINSEDYKQAKKWHCKMVKMINGVGVNTSKFSNIYIDINAYKNSLNIPRDKTIVLSIGEISKRKNHQIIIKAIGRLQKENYVYIICGRELGSNKLTTKLKNLAKENGVTLMLLGHRSDIPQIITCSDIGAIPSVREGLGLAGIESLASGVPLVGSNVQGISDYIVDGKTGFKYFPFDEEGFAKGIEELSNRSVRMNMKDSCCEMAKMYDIAISVHQMKEIYDSILKNNS